MRKIIKSLVLIAALGALPSGSAQTITVCTDDFQTSAQGPTGAVAWNYTGSGIGNPEANIVTDNLDGTNTQNCAFTFETSSNTVLNFGLETDWLPANGNTITFPAAYTLEFDMAVQGISISDLGGYVGPVLGLFGNYGGMYYGDGGMIGPAPTYFPEAGTGYQHFSVPFTEFTPAHANLLPATDSPLAFFIGFYIPAATNYGTVEIDLANIQVTMLTNPPAPPSPQLTLLATTPELRLFAQNYAQTYNTEGFLSVDQSQSWVGSVPGKPPTYSITYKDFNTVPGFSQATTFVPNDYMANGGPASSPYTIYYGSNALSLTITAEATNFTASLDWKTNAPTGGQTNNVLLITNTIGVGTWTLKFTDDTNGTLTAPAGSPFPFTLPAAMAAQFANPCTIFYGITPNSIAGYGQYIDLQSISITNVVGVNEYDDFTKDDILNSNLWDTGYSLDAGSVIQVSTNNTPYWLIWTVPAIGFGLETKASLSDTNTPWRLPSYWNNVTPVSKQMGPSNVWTLLPVTCLPLDTTLSTNTPQGFFKLQNPPTAN